MFRQPPRRTSARFRPALECLEGRCNPSNLTATVKAGVLTITADVAGSNDVIAISPAGSGIPGSFDIASAGATTINNNPINTDVEVRGVRAIVLNLRGGANTVDFTGLLMGGITFNGGAGNNTLNVLGG